MSPMAMGGRDRYNFELALDRCVCYPMEKVTLTVRVKMDNPSRTLLCIHLPQKTEIESVRMTGVDDNFLSVYTNEFVGTLLTVPVAKYLDPGAEADILVDIRLNTLKINHYLSFCAWTAADIPDVPADGIFVEPRGSRSIDLAVKANASYLQYLPELYSYDDFVNRFLMMFESFWKPISQQITQVEDYFDPSLTPESFLNWLASWVGMQIDETFPKERIRLLIRNAIPFYHSRGTAKSLQFFLEMYSGGKVEIQELKAQNMVIGGIMGMGDGMALGKNNKPNTVLVNMTVPASELERTGFTKEKYEMKINSFIRSIVPAHTVFSLSCKFE